MTELAVHPYGAGATSRLAELRELSRSLSDLLAELDPEPEGCESSAGDALHRLLSGRAQPNDHLLLHAPLREARIAVVRTSCDRTHQQAGRVLQDLPRTVVTGTPRPREWAVLVPALPRRADSDRPRTAAQALFSRAQAVAEDARVGVSTQLERPEDFPRALEEACLAASRPGTGLVFADDEWAGIALDRLRRHVGGCLPGHNPLAVLAEHDERRGSSFVETLTAWLRADGDTRRAAAELSVHTNTLRYRLARLQEISALDLSDPTARVLAHLTLL